MLNSINPKKSATMLFLIIVCLKLSSCAMASPPALEMRTLTLRQDQPSLEYKYEECTSEFLGICFASELHHDLYDLSKPEVRKQLRDMGFVMQVREKP